MGYTHLKLYETNKAKDYFKQAEVILLQLVYKVPEAIEFQDSLKWVKDVLEKLENL